MGSEHVTCASVWKGDVRSFISHTAKYSQNHDTIEWVIVNLANSHFSMVIMTEIAVAIRCNIHVGCVNCLGLSYLV